LKEIEELSLHNRTRTFYRMVTDMRKGFKPRILAGQKEDGEIIINNKNEILERWYQCFQKLLEGKEENDKADKPVEPSTEEHQNSQEGINLPTVEELEKAIDKCIFL
jgi:hypothetical protein